MPRFSFEETKRSTMESSVVSRPSRKFREERLRPKPLFLIRSDDRSKKVSFPIWKDEDIGLGFGLCQKYSVSLQQDDDQATDEEIMKSALKTCWADLDQAAEDGKNYGWRVITKNIKIEERVMHPEYFDRCGNDKRTSAD